MNPIEPVRRTQEIEDKTNLFLVHPLSNRLVPILAKWHVSPNAVSVCGMVCGAAAGVAYNHYTNTLACVLGFLLMIAWHVMDGADGQLARLTNSQSATGKVLDGVCDYVTFTAVYVGLALPLSRSYGAWVWAVVAISGACHAVQSAAYELQRQDYDHFVCGRKSAAPATAVQKGPARRPSIGMAFGMLDRLYVGIQHLATGVSAARRLDMASAFDPAVTRQGMKDLYREVFARRVRQWSVMSANYRTLGIFVFAVAGAPLFYFIWEIAILSLLTIFLLSWQRCLYEDFFTRAYAVAPSVR